MNFSVAIFGCKKYEDVAYVFVNEFLPINKKLFSNSFFFTDEFIPDLKVDQISISEDLLWSSRIANSLKEINTEFILFLLDDYFLTEELDVDIIELLVDRCKNESIKYCRLINHPYDKNFGDFKPISVKPYSINLQPALWDREFLISILSKINSNPWKTEISLSKYFQSNSNFYINAVGFILIEKYLNGVIKGKWSRDMPIDLIKNSQRPLMTKREWFFYFLKSRLSSVLNPSLKKLTKIILKKFCFKFHS